MRHRHPFAIGLTGFILATGLATAPSMAMTTSFCFQEAQPSVMDIQIELIHQSMTPDVLCAAGLTANETSSLLTFAIGAIQADWDTVFSTQTALNELDGQRTSLEQSLKSSGLDDSTRASLESQLNAVEALIASHQATLNGVRATIETAVLNSMSTDDRTRFQQINANSARNVPMEYRILDLTEDQWADLRHAFAVVKTNDEPTPEATQVIAGYNTQYDVNLVRVYLDTNQTAVNTAYMQAMSAVGS
ncbi:hypothetical protein COB72_01040 [bacterium]|nr:MAG: hypothetical protein COB72_01040 [bacterium]